MKILKKIWLVHVVTLLLFGLPLQAQQVADTLKVLMIGNSFSQNASRYLPQLAKETGIKLVLGRAEMGGCSLQRHWDSVEVNNADVNRGKAYNKKSLRQLLASQKWDIVTLQQYSLLSADAGTYQPYANNLVKLIKQYQPDAKIMIHQTWAYRADAKSFGRVDGNKKAETQQEMWQKSRAAYHKLAKDLGGLQIIPSGDAFYAVATDKNWAFKGDPDFDYANPVYPNLPNEQNSINVGYSYSKEQKIKFDANHANEAGCYLAGLVWFKAVLGQNPIQVTFKPASVSNEFAAFLRETALAAVNSVTK